MWVREMDKIRVGLVFEDKEDAVSFMRAYSKDTTLDNGLEIYESSTMVFHWIKPFSLALGLRLNFVFTTQDVRNTDWFNTVIRPMLMPGEAIID